MLKLIISVFIGVVLFGWALSSSKSRILLFWISLMLFFDPGGFFSGYLSGDIIWRIKYYDVFFGFMLLAYILNKERRINFLPNPSLKRISEYLLYISLYFLLITGILIPLIKGYPNITFFLQKNRQFFYALPMFIMTYHFTVASVKVFYKVLVVFSAIILILYMVSLLTSFKIIPFYTLSRYGEGDRISMISYGLINWVLPMGIIFLALGRGSKLPYKNYLLLSFALMLITILLTLTRREFLRIVFMTIVIPYLLSKINKTLYINKYSKFIFPALGIIFLLILLFPRYIDLSIRILNDSFHLIITGRDTQGIEDYRVTGTGDLEIAKDIIYKNLLFGIGYYPAQWSDIVEMKHASDTLGLALDAASEVPVYGALMTLGCVGLIIPVLLFWYLFKLWGKAFRTLRNYYNKINKYPVELIISITMLFFLLSKVTIDLYGLFGEFYSPYSFTDFAITIGIWQGTYQRTKYLISSEHSVKTNLLIKKTV
jgi:hypothetical protein